VSSEEIMADEILWSVQDDIATVTLHRPEKRNALNDAALQELSATFATLEQRQDVRVVVLRGAGKAFCSGRDLREMGQRQARGAGEPPVDIVHVFRQIETSRHPTIAMVHGDALAGGCELALHCDVRIAAETARFGMPLARLGLIVPFDLGGKLVEIIGPANTRQLLLTAQPVDGKQALAMGLVQQVVPAADLEAATNDLARTIAANAPLALAGIKAIIQRTLSARQQLAHEDLDAMVERARRSADAREGVQAMLEKRHPVFRGA
jgi:enoyl-CoA hydratase/carnithine racemase